MEMEMKASEGEGRKWRGDGSESGREDVIKSHLSHVISHSFTGCKANDYHVVEATETFLR